MKVISKLLVGCCLVVSVPGWAGFNLMLHKFTGEEPTMSPGPHTETDYCMQFGITEVPAALPYHVLGTAQVSQSGQYRTVDIGVGWFGIQGSGDGTLYIYEGSFDPANPGANRVGAFNRSYENFVNDQEWVMLEAGTDYVMVVQLACRFEQAIAGLSLRGPGEITGAGLQAADYAYGNYADSSNIADFPDFGTHKYADPYAYTAPRTGNYMFLDVGIYWANVGSATAHKIYTEPFDPENPDANLYFSSDFFFFGIYLKKGQTVYIVNVDITDTDDIYQTVIYPPAALPGINPEISGTFYNPAQSGQGLLLEADGKLDLMFMALFTFEDKSGSSLQQSVGSSDQRWLTAFGSFDRNSTTIPLHWERASGGRFNEAEPPAVIDSDYGTGELRALDCNTLEVTYSLPGAVEGVFELVRLLPAKGRACSYYLPIDFPLTGSE